MNKKRDKKLILLNYYLVICIIILIVSLKEYEDIKSTENYKSNSIE